MLSKTDPDQRYEDLIVWFGLIVVVRSFDSHSWHFNRLNLIDTGERGIIFVGGEVTHGLLKMPKPKTEENEREHFVVNTDFGGTWSIYQPTTAEVEFAKQVAAGVADSVGVWPAYLRVDIFYDNNDELALMEIAAGTANIWLEQVPEAAHALARYIDKQLTKIETDCDAYYEQLEWQQHQKQQQEKEAEQ